MDTAQAMEDFDQVLIQTNFNDKKIFNFINLLGYGGSYGSGYYKK